MTFYDPKARKANKAEKRPCNTLNRLKLIESSGILGCSILSEKMFISLDLGGADKVRHGPFLLFKKAKRLCDT